MQRANRLKGRLLIFLLLVVTLAGAAATSHSAASSQTAAGSTVSIVSGTVSLLNSKRKDPANVVVWLEPLSGQARKRVAEEVAIHQVKKKFVPRVVVIQTSQKVDFPNDDPFQHNVFSSSELKRFDLGLYQAGESRPVSFSRPGVIPIFCNIHPQMKAYVIVVKTPYYTQSNDKGEISLQNVPAGSYRLKVWHERCRQENLDKLTRQITVGQTGFNLGSIELDESGFFDTQHKNKDGRDYLPN
ncbi:MAG: hypothetical protein AB1489_05755 [Acidobacteriota bacterium]